MGKNIIGRWFSGSTPPADKAVARDVEESAEAGDAEAQFKLALIYSSGNGVMRDAAKAAAWFLKAAEQNHGLAQLHLAKMFAAGRGVPQDTAQSLSWYHRAARQGIAEAQFKWACARQRASMDGAEADAPEVRIEAYMWYELAAPNYPPALGASAQLTIKMTRDEVTEARRRVAAWTPGSGATDLP
jgi:TPR repeat protein